MAAPISATSAVSEPTLDRNSWFSHHPKLKEMQSWGFHGEDQTQNTLLVYLDLCEAKNWWHVNIHPCPDLSMPYITGKPHKKDDVQTVLPVTTQADLSMKRLQSYLEHIPFPPKKENADNGENQKVITLAIVDTDSTIVYYRIANGLLSPELETAAEKQEKKNKRRKKKKTKPECEKEFVDVRCEEEKVDPFQEEEL